MRNRKWALLLLLFLALGSLVPAQPAAASVSVSISFFYDHLSPYGEWVVVNDYGRCWRPLRVARTWHPYVNGRWYYTDYGWTWASYDRWGGDTYHYGTWVWTDDYGWIWVPGTVWAPAWVTWYVSDSYVGWAPVPASFVVSTSGYAGPPITSSYNSYVFVPATQFVTASNVSSVRVAPAQTTAIVAQAQPVTSFAVRGGVLSNTGPSLPLIERASRHQVHKAGLQAARVRPARFSGGSGRAAVIAPKAELERAIGARMSSKVAKAERSAPHAAAPPARVERGRPEVASRHVSPRHQAEPRHVAPGRGRDRHEQRLAPGRGQDRHEKRLAPVYAEPRARQHWRGPVQRSFQPEPIRQPRPVPVHRMEAPPRMNEQPPRGHGHEQGPGRSMAPAPPPMDGGPGRGHGGPPPGHGGGGPPGQAKEHGKPGRQG